MHARTGPWVAGAAAGARVRKTHLTAALAVEQERVPTEETTPEAPSTSTGGGSQNELVALAKPQKVRHQIPPWPLRAVPLANA